MESILRKIIYSILIDEASKEAITSNINSLSNSQIKVLVDFIIDNRISYLFLKKINYSRIHQSQHFDDLKSQSDRFKIQQHQIIHETLNINNALSKLSINGLFLKGVSVAFFYYSDFYERPMLDIDILIANKDLIKFYRSLRNDGYEFYNKKLNNISEKSLVEIMKSNHQIPALIKNNRVSIELHNRITLSKDFEECPLYKIMLDTKIHKKFFENDIFVPSPKKLLLHLIVHFSYGSEFFNHIVALSDIKNIICYENINMTDFYKEQENIKIKKATLIVFGILDKNFFNNDFIESVEFDDSKQSVYELISITEDKIFSNKIKDINQFVYADLLNKNFYKLIKEKVLINEFSLRLKYDLFDKSKLYVYLFYFKNFMNLIINRFPIYSSSFFETKKNINLSKKYKRLYDWLKD